MNDVATGSNQIDISESKSSRDIDYPWLTPVELGDYNPRKDSYYEPTAYDVSQRDGITIPLNGTTEIIQPTWNRLFFQGFRGDEAIAKKDPISELSTESPSEYFRKTNQAEPATMTEYDKEREKTEYFRIWLYGIKINYLLGLLIQAGYLIIYFFWPVIILAPVVIYFLDSTAHFKDFLFSFFDVALIFLGGFIAWKGGNYLRLKTDKARWGYVDRKTGMVVMPQRKGPDVVMPYKEFEPRIVRRVGSAGVSHSLAYVHYTGKWRFSGGERFAIDALLQAAYIEQFMDITQPLPDIPSLERFRHLDPTTVAYDKMINRDPNYWRSKTSKEIDAIAKERTKFVASYVGKDVFTV